MPAEAKLKCKIDSALRTAGFVKGTPCTEALIVAAKEQDLTPADETKGADCAKMPLKLYMASGKV